MRWKLPPPVTAGSASGNVQLRLLYLERGVDMVARWGSLLGKKHGVSMVHYGKSIGKSIGQLMTKEHDRLDWEDEKPYETMIIMCISEKSKSYQSRELLKLLQMVSRSSPYLPFALTFHCERRYLLTIFTTSLICWLRWLAIDRASWNQLPHNHRWFDQYGHH